MTVDDTGLQRTKKCPPWGWAKRNQTSANSTMTTTNIISLNLPVSLIASEKSHYSVKKLSACFYATFATGTKLVNAFDLLTVLQRIVLSKREYIYVYYGSNGEKTAGQGSGK
jgi:hypothetical protein